MCTGIDGLVMRADRLITLLIILQTRGRTSARQLAKELEVSERTIYRDVLALSAAGIPIYSETGCNGGFALVDRYRTNLTGLTEKEARALFMLSIPTPLAELGVAEELRAALLKLSAAMPDFQRSNGERVRQRIYIDSSGWRLNDKPVPFLQTVHQALWDDRKLLVSYRPVFPVQVQYLVEPLGLVAKGGIWHLVFRRQERARVIRLSELLNVQASDERFVRPVGFDLASFWESWCIEVDALSDQFKARVRAAPKIIPELVRSLGEDILAQRDASKPGEDPEWIELELAFETFEAARQKLLGLGRAVEILAPLPLRASVLDFAEQIVELYKRNLYHPRSIDYH